jgi:hypothetical protein
MVEAARKQAARFDGMVHVEQRRWEDLAEADVADLATALGVFDYIPQATELLSTMLRAAPSAAASFPSVGLRTWLRKVRYGRKGVGVYGYRPADLHQLARNTRSVIEELRPVGRAGHLVHFRRDSA